MSIIGKVKLFLDMKKKQQRKEIATLQKLIQDLNAKANGMKKRCDNETDKDKKEKLEKEYKAVKRLLKKSKKRVIKLYDEL